MKKEDLESAIGKISPDLILEAAPESAQTPVAKTVSAPERNRAKTILRFAAWTAPVAALLAAAILITAFFGGGSLFSGLTGKLIPAKKGTFGEIYCAIYPSMPKRPTTYESDREEWDTWSEAIEKQADYRGKEGDLTGFLKTSVGEFLSGEDGENAVCSPLSVYLALSMLAELSDGNTRAEILDLLGTDSVETLRKQANALWNANFRDDGATKSLIGNSVWLNEDLIPAYHSDTFRTLAENYFTSSYSGEMGSADYNKQFRGWISEHTGGLLDEAVNGQELASELVLALVNTVYFKACWSDGFGDDKFGFFHAPDGDQTLHFLRSPEDKGFLYQADGFSAYGKEIEADGGKLGNDSRMWFILPDEGSTPESLLANEELLDFVASGCRNGESSYVTADLTVPEFDVSSEMDLIPKLLDLGVTDCFRGDVADFSPMSDIDDVFVNAVSHSARVAIDKDGVSAASYTIIQMAEESCTEGAVLPFTVDRPFLFVLTGLDGLPLFVGIVNHP